MKATNIAFETRKQSVIISGNIPTGDSFHGRIMGTVISLGIGDYRMVSFDYLTGELYSVLGAESGNYGNQHPLDAITVDDMVSLAKQVLIRRIKDIQITL